MAGRDRASAAAAAVAAHLVIIMGWLCGPAHRQEPTRGAGFTGRLGVEDDVLDTQAARWGTGTTAGAFSTTFVVSALAGIYVGRVLDRRGPRTAPS